MDRITKQRLGVLKKVNSKAPNVRQVASSFNKTERAVQYQLHDLRDSGLITKAGHQFVPPYYTHKEVNSSGFIDLIKTLEHILGDQMWAKLPEKVLEIFNTLQIMILNPEPGDESVTVTGTKDKGIADPQEGGVT